MGILSRNKFCGNCTNYCDKICQKYHKHELNKIGCSKHVFISEKDEVTRKKKSIASKRQHANMTQKQKQIKSKKISVVSKKAHTCKTFEELSIWNKKISKSNKVAYNNRSEEFENSRKEKLSIAAKRQFELMTDEEKQSISKKISEANKIAYINKSEEEKIEHSRRSHKNMINYHANMSDEDKQKRSKNMSDGLKAYQDSLTLEDKNEFKQKMHEVYVNMTEEEKEEMRRKQKEGIRNMSPEKEMNRRKKISTTLSKPEHVVLRSKAAIDRLNDPNSNFGKYFNREYKDTGIIMRSGYETKLASKFDNYSKHWEYEPNTFWLKSLKRRYTPDFYYPELNCYIEVKSRYYLSDLVYLKIEAMKTDHNIIVLLIHDDNWYNFENIIFSSLDKEIKLNKLILLSFDKNCIKNKKVA